MWELYIFFHLRMHRRPISSEVWEAARSEPYHQSIPPEYEQIPARNIHLSILKNRAIFHRGGPWKASVFKVWEAASSGLTICPFQLKYGKFPAGETSSVHSSDLDYHAPLPFLPKIELLRMRKLSSERI
jgi:hypothetical protein